MTQAAESGTVSHGLTERKPLRVCLVGWGSINRRVAQYLCERTELPIDIAALAVRHQPSSGEGPATAEVITDPDRLADLDIDFVVEAAGRDAVAQWGEAALRHAKAMAVASASAFCDTALLDRLITVAKGAGSQIIVPSGALAGIDGLAAASLLDLDEVVHRIVKPPAAWRGTPSDALIDLDALGEPMTFFAGSAREAASRYPNNANVAAISALAGIGLERTRVELVAHPGAAYNGHFLTARGAFGRLEISIENRPLALNPKTSELAALALVRAIENRVSPIVF